MGYRTDNFNIYCDKCSLSSGKAVHSYAECRFEDALLLIVSDYPSTLEEKTGIPFTPVDKEGEINGGKFIRKLIGDIFNKDERIPSRYQPFINHVILANAIRCNPNRGKEILVIGTKELNECHDWLSKDLARVHPNIPILLSGSKAVMSVLGKDMRVNSSRRYIHQLEGHPVVVCENFANAARYLTKEVVTTYKRRKDGLVMPKTSRLISPIPLSPAWNLIKDVQLIKESVLDFILRYK